MASQPPVITFSTGLLEKFAGLKKPEPPKPVLPRAPLASIQLPVRTGISPDAARLITQDQQLSRQLQATKEVSGLLLKNEASELALVAKKAQELLQRHSLTAKPLPCQAESQACAQCFRDNATEAWKCAEAAEAYRLCSLAAFKSSRAAAPAASG